MYTVVRVQLYIARRESAAGLPGTGPSGPVQEGSALAQLPTRAARWESPPELNLQQGQVMASGQEERLGVGPDLEAILDEEGRTGGPPAVGSGDALVGHTGRLRKSATQR